MMLVGAMLLSLCGCGGAFGSVAPPDPFAPNDLERAVSYIKQNKNYTVTKDQTMGTGSATQLLVTKNRIQKHFFNRYDYYVASGSRIVTFYRLEVGSASSPKTITQEEFDAVTEPFTQCLDRQWEWDEASQKYFFGDDTLEIGESSILVKDNLSTGDFPIFTTYLFEDFGKTSVTLPKVSL